MTKYNVLYIEDNEHDARLGKKLLEKHGFVVNIATDGQETIELIESFSPDILLVDINLPGVNGLDLIIQLKHSGITVPVVAISSLADDILEQAEAIGCDAVFKKPVTAKLPQLLEDILDHSKESVTIYNTANVDPLTRYQISAALRLHKSLIKQKEMADTMAYIKNSLLNIISHELKTPQALQWGYVSLLKEMSVNSDPALVEIVDKMVDASARMNVILDTVDTASRIVNDTLELTMTSINLLSLLDWGILEAASESEKENRLVFVKIVRQNEDLENLTVVGDKNYLLEALGELLSNAIKETGDNGSVTISLSIKNRMACLQFEDGGNGPSYDDYRTMKYPLADLGDYKQHHSGRYRRGGKGLGLGMYVANGILEAHGGRIVNRIAVGEHLPVIVELPVNVDLRLNA